MYGVGPYWERNKQASGSSLHLCNVMLFGTRDSAGEPPGAQGGPAYPSVRCLVQTAVKVGVLAIVFGNWMPESVALYVHPCSVSAGRLWPDQW